MFRSTQSKLFLAVGALLAACAQEQPPINRVQPDYFDKAFFVGQDYLSAGDDPEFYSQGTLVDVGYGAGQDGLFTSTYAQPLSRVKWTVQENLLVARLAYERINNSDGKGMGGATNDGVVVAAYPILRHFDIQRTYNPSTGEQLNVIEENSFDRPWYQRQYMRVDWSRNLSTDNYDYDTLSMLGIYGGVTYEPLAYYVNDPTHEDAPHFAPEEGYLDITNKAFARPQMIDLSHLGWGMTTIPACWLDADFAGGTAPTTGCSPVELTIRQSFRKVTKTDYEPIDWDGYRFQAFGAFDTNRKGYSRNYGMTDTQWHRFINRYNIWERHHFYSDSAKMTGEVACYTPDTTPAGLGPNRDDNGDGTADECESVGRGSQCDSFNQKCTLPFRDRTPAPVVWYYANGSHPEFFEPTHEATNEWDVAIRSAIQTARYAECMRTNDANCAERFPVYTGQQDDNADAIALAREVDDCRNGRAHLGKDCTALADELGTLRGYTPGVIALAKMDEVVVLCHSPVEAGDPKACGGNRLPSNISAAQCNQAYQSGADKELIATCRQARNVRRGDLRYHQVNSIDIPQTPSPWGIMVDSNDPLSGEVVAASINVWTHVNDLWSQGVVDVARYIKGELATSDVTEGNYVREWAQAAEAATRNGALAPMTSQQLESRIAGLTGTTPERLRALSRQLATPQLKAQIRKVEHELSLVRADVSAPSTLQPLYEARRKKAIGSATEAALITPMMQSFAGTSKLPNSEAAMQFASPLRGANPTLARDMRHRKEVALAERGSCVMHQAPAPVAMADLSELLQAKFGNFNRRDQKAVQLERAEKMRRYLAQRAHYAVVSHEMGHSVGLRHNFVSSSDAFNYRPQYWQLRTNNGTVTEECTTLRPDGSCVGPRYFDPVTENERKNLITMFMQSSTMDYAGEAAQDFLGLGAYDFAAARMFYGDVVSVFADPSYKLGTPRAAGMLEKMDSFGGIIGIRPSIGTGSRTETEPLHYSALQNKFGMISNCRDIDPNAFKPSTWNEDLLGTWHPLLDGQLVQVGGTYSRCRQQPVDYVNWNQLRKARTNEVSFTRASNAIDPTGRVRFPYGFGTDNWADLGNLSVYRHDNGADPYELFDFLITQQEINHIFDNYRRNRQTFTVRGAAVRQLTRYNEKLRDAAKGLGLMANIYRDFANDMGYDFESLWPYIGNEFFAENILASSIAFDHFAKGLSRPSAGPHYVSDLGNGDNKKVLRSAVDTAGNAGSTALIVPNGATGVFRNVSPGGRPVENALAEDKGEYDSQFTVNAGSYYEKAWTAMLMTESFDNFISDSRRDFVDARYRAVSLADLFPDSFRRFLANNLTGDEELKAPRVAQNPNGSPSVDAERYPTSGLGWISWTRPTPEACFLASDSLLCGASPKDSMPIESQVGWEQQKFLIAWTLNYLPENQQQTWLNQLGIWEIGEDADPGFTNRVELHLPNGKKYVARTFGKETVLGKTVQKGIAARVLEYANQLLNRAYVTTNGPDLDGDSTPDWYVPTYVGGKPVVKYDAGIVGIAGNGGLQTSRPGCNTTENSACTCTANRACMALGKYEQLPFFMRQAMRDYGMADPSMKGIY